MCDLTFCRAQKQVLQLNDRPNGIRYCDNRKRAIRRTGEIPAQELHSGKTANPFGTITFVLFRKPIARCRLRQTERGTINKIVTVTVAERRKLWQKKMMS